jgi:hypothetical protein
LLILPRKKREVVEVKSHPRKKDESRNLQEVNLDGETAVRVLTRVVGRKTAVMTMDLVRG